MPAKIPPLGKRVFTGGLRDCPSLGAQAPSGFASRSRHRVKNDEKREGRPMRWAALSFRWCKKKNTPTWGSEKIVRQQKEKEMLSIRRPPPVLDGCPH